MTQRKVLLPIVLIIVLILVYGVVHFGFSKPSLPSNTPISDQLTQISATSSMESITTAVGQNFEITLPSNGTTGYTWSMTQNPDATVIDYLGMQTEAPTSTLIGAPGAQVWQFKALAMGTTSFTLRYARSWDPTDNPSTHVVSVEVVSSK